MESLTDASKNRLKRAKQNLSKPENNSGLVQTKFNQLKRIVEKAVGKVRVDLKGVKGTGVKPHAHVEGLGSKIEHRHIWLQEGVR